MRISDWSSDVCSSDLPPKPQEIKQLAPPQASPIPPPPEEPPVVFDEPSPVDVQAPPPAQPAPPARKSVVSGKSGSVRVDLGGSRTLQQTNTQTTTQTYSYDES